MRKRKNANLTANFKKFLKQIEKRVDLALVEWIEDLHQVSDSYTPKDTGKLRESFYTENMPAIGSLVKKEVGYGKNLIGSSGGSYADIVHEWPDDKNWTTPGTGPRYLERAMYEKIPELLPRVSAKTGMR